MPIFTHFFEGKLKETTATSDNIEEEVEPFQISRFPEQTRYPIVAKKIEKISLNECYVVRKDPGLIKSVARYRIHIQNIIKQLSSGHALVVRDTSPKTLIGKMGFCVECIKSAPIFQIAMKKVRTYCSACRDGSWICEHCFDESHNVVKF
jgi:hypothetical protein